ncbi:MAG: potassium transporter TrkG, partial [Bacteroidota bacterium]
ADYMQWPSFAWTLLFVAMFLGGSTGSTAGGIKIARHVLLLRNIQRTFRQLINPNAVLPMRLNNNSINESDNNSILSFIAVYILVFMAGSLLMMLMGVEARESASSVATCMAGIGPGLGSVGPVGNFAQVPAMGKILLSFLMLVGRLEIFTVLMLFTKTFWKK